MGATHRLEVLEATAKAVTLRIAIAHEDEQRIPLFRTAMLAMLCESVAAAEDAEYALPANASSIFTDEPEDEDEAAKVIASVTLVRIESGKAKVQNPRQGVRFAKKGNAACAVVVELVPAKKGVFKHLKPGLKWEAAPLFPEMEEDWPEEDED